MKSNNFFYHFFHLNSIHYLTFACFIHFSSSGLSHLCYKELQPTLEMSFHLSLNKEKHFCAWQQVLRGRPWQLLFILWATAAQISTKFLLISVWNNIILQGPTLGVQRLLYPLLSYVCAYQCNFSPSDAARNREQWWGGVVAPCHHELVITHLRHRFIESLLCTKLCVKFIW